MINKDKLNEEIKDLKEMLSNKENDLQWGGGYSNDYTQVHIHDLELQIEILESIYNCLD